MATPNIHLTGSQEYTLMSAIGLLVLIEAELRERNLELHVSSANEPGVRIEIGSHIRRVLRAWKKQELARALGLKD